MSAATRNNSKTELKEKRQSRVFRVSVKRRTLTSESTGQEEGETDKQASGWWAFQAEGSPIVSVSKDGEDK